MKIGLEKEYFCVNGKQEVVVVPPDIAHDSCGWLFEARSKPFQDVEEAVFSLAAAEFKIIQAATPRGLTALEVPIMEVSRKVRNQASRHYVKSLRQSQNLYGHEDHDVDYPLATAGIHISFTEEEVINIGPGAKRTVNRIFDYAKLFRALDSVFSAEIKSSGRLPGFYELKADGRIEYRSLPNNIEGERLINGIQQALKEYYSTEKAGGIPPDDFDDEH